MTRTILSLVAAAVLVVGCSTGEPLRTAGQPDVTETNTIGDVGAGEEAGEEFGADFGEFDALLDVSDQTTDGDAVQVAQASIDPGPGWVVIYTSKADSPDEVIGFQQVEANLTDITVELDQPLEPGEYKLWAQMHVDADPIGDFQWPGSDIPVTREDEDVVQSSFTLTVEE